MGCDHNCSSCSSANGCSEIQKAKLNDKSSIKKIIAVLSGKGGVGKSFVTSTLAVALAKKGFKVGILDADVTGPSIPRAFGIRGNAYGDGGLIFPIESNKYAIKTISSNNLLENENEPIIWRGTLLSNLVKQFYENVLWEELDYLLIDMPPGTGDITLTTFQLIPVDDLIIVTSPQDLVSMIVTKAINMARQMNINVLGVIENMSYVKCPNCDEKIKIYGESHLDEFAEKLDFKVLGRLPIDTANVTKVDNGDVEDVELEELNDAVSAIIGE